MLTFQSRIFAFITFTSVFPALNILREESPNGVIYLRNSRIGGRCLLKWWPKGEYIMIYLVNDVERNCRGLYKLGFVEGIEREKNIFPG